MGVPVNATRVACGSASPQVVGVAFQQVVVAAVCLVDDHDDVPAVRKQRVLRPCSFSALVRPNFCNVVKMMPPTVLPVSSAHSSSRVATCRGWSVSSSLASNVSKS